MKKAYIVPTVDIIVIEHKTQLLAGSVTQLPEVLDNTDAATSDDFIQLSPEMTFDSMDY